MISGGGGWAVGRFEALVWLLPGRGKASRSWLPVPTASHPKREGTSSPREASTPPARLPLDSLVSCFRLRSLSLCSVRVRCLCLFVSCTLALLLLPAFLRPLQLLSLAPRPSPSPSSSSLSPNHRTLSRSLARSRLRNPRPLLNPAVSSRGRAISTRSTDACRRCPPAQSQRRGILI